MKKGFLTADLQNFILAGLPQPPKAFINLEQKIAAHPQGIMSIPRDQGIFMAWLLDLMQARDVLEIGTFIGYSTLWLAQGVGPSGRVTTVDHDQRLAGIAREAWAEAGLADRIHIVHGDGCAVMAAQADCSMDFIFIDGDKQGYPEYLRLSQRVVRPGGIVAFDNALWEGLVVDSSDQTEMTQAIRHVWQHLDPTIWQPTHVPIGDGLLLLRRNL